MISSESRTISGLRRIRTPRAPVQKRKPARQRYQTTSGPFTGVLPRVAAEDDAADSGDEQDDRGDLEGEQVIGQEETSDVVGPAEEGVRRRLVREAPARLQPDHDDHLDEDGSGGRHGSDRLPARPARPGRSEEHTSE